MNGRRRSSQIAVGLAAVLGLTFLSADAKTENDADADINVFDQVLDLEDADEAADIEIFDELVTLGAFKQNAGGKTQERGEANAAQDESLLDQELLAFDAPANAETFDELAELDVLIETQHIKDPTGRSAAEEDYRNARREWLEAHRSARTQYREAVSKRASQSRRAYWEARLSYRQAYRAARRAQREAYRKARVRYGQVLEGECDSACRKARRMAALDCQNGARQAQEDVREITSAASDACTDTQSVEGRRNCRRALRLVLRARQVAARRAAQRCRLTTWAAHQTCGAGSSQ